MSQFSEIIRSPKPTLVDFHATWCGPCKMLAPVIVDLKKTVGDKLTVLKIDVDKNQEVAATYGIQGVPTLILFKNGNIVWRQSGYLTLNQIQNAINPFI
ncbi:thioredoxin [Haoranjiania flava]|uniref:Thioredoxin n=1 Tax=Haoranjiania flava TaxID=1856322 RepID=A0AAE3LIV1_9BACT|nr:thioredoxin [Haoranjiania flava]MCU7692968.1 thioredoxin [Haoranjiania flava]